ncbi:ammonium transporter [Bacteriovoracales bacterium]|nr:ammonium transporter [Bacteriovoracales bacterium]
MGSNTIDVLWVMICSGLVLLMQLGFLALESGLTRNKNNINVALKNLSDFGLSFFLFWVFGFAFGFGMPLFNDDIFSHKEFFFFFSDSSSLVAFFIFQTLFCNTAATIVSGAVAERMKFNGFLAFVVLMALAFYPFVVNLVWSGSWKGEKWGWLAKQGFLDFAGSTVVHSTGGWVALALVIVIGPRLNRFDPRGKPREIHGSSYPFSILGVFALWVGWVGFNGGSTMGFTDSVGPVILNTFLGGTCGLLWGIFLSSLLNWGVPSGNHLINSCLGGLVSVTAGANVFNADSIFLIGGVAAVVVIFVDKLLIKFKIDDAVGAIPVHLGGGIWGTIAVALFSDPVLKGNSLTFLEQLKIQSLGIIVTGVPVFFGTYFVAKVINSFYRLRVKKEDEIIGLNISEHKAQNELFEMLLFMKAQSLQKDYRTKAPEDPFTTVGLIGYAYNEVTQSMLIYRDELEHSKKVLEEKNIKLRKYDYTVAHDLKSPIKGIKKNLDLLEKNLDTYENKKDYLKNMKLLTKESIDIINKFLKVTINGDVNLHSVYLPDIIEKLKSKFKKQIEKIEGSFLVDLDEDYVLADEVLLEQIISNIITNSIKYSAFPVRKLELKISTYIKNEKVFIIVEDNGLGIEEKDQPYIFEKDWRSQSNKSVEGQGIGLFTVKNVVENMRGSLQCESSKNNFTKMVIGLPKVQDDDINKK